MDAINYSRTTNPSLETKYFGNGSLYLYEYLLLLAQGFYLLVVSLFEEYIIHLPVGNGSNLNLLMYKIAKKKRCATLSVLRDS